MRPKLVRALRLTLVSLMTLAGVFAVATRIRAARTFDAPLPDLHASAAPEVVARGRYLALGPAHCADCHGESLAGGRAFHLPVGTFYVPNVTPDVKTGIGRHSDPELARVLRHGVKPDGRVAIPFMSFANLADDDLVAILSYLRSVRPVEHAVPDHDVNALGKVVLAWILTPAGPSGTPKRSMPPALTPEYGEYLANDVANCRLCHTQLDMKTGVATGPLFGGGGVHEANDGSGKQFISPNLTPHRRWGWLEGWTEDAFMSRMQRGSGREGSPMPWPSFQRLSDDDARAIYRYLRTLPPAASGPDPRERNPVSLVARQ